MNVALLIENKTMGQTGTNVKTPANLTKVFLKNLQKRSLAVAFPLGSSLLAELANTTLQKIEKS